MSTATNMSEGFKYVENKRLSKTQKRRDAKAAKKAEQARRVQEEEGKKSHEERRIENENFANLLTKHNLRIHEIDADGDCLFKAIEHQLSLAPDSEERLSSQELRDRTSEYMLDHGDDFLPFLSNQQGNMMNRVEFVDYCTKIAKTKEWGGHLELTAITQLTKKPIHIYQADSMKPIVIQPTVGSDKQPILLSFHKHLYHLGEHYNSLVCLD